jgi:hypothetical protein
MNRSELLSHEPLQSEVKKFAAVEVRQTAQGCFDSSAAGAALPLSMTDCRRNLAR